MTNDLPLSLSADHLENLRQAYATPPRAYHSFAHVEEMQAHFRSVTTWARPREVAVALLYHDIIYVAGRSDNEAKSAALAVQDCARLWPDIDAASVERMILLTASHGKLQSHELSEDERLFLDCDMAILGASWERFVEYDKQIAQEYVSLPRLLYRSGRERFLKRLLKSPHIYLSDTFRQRLEAAARSNIKRLLDA